MFLSKCAVWNTKNWNFIKDLKPIGLLSSLGIKMHLSKITLVGPLLF